MLLVFSEYIELARSLTDTDNTFCFCMDNSGTGAILVYHHLYEPKQIVKNVLVPTVIWITVRRSFIKLNRGTGEVKTTRTDRTDKELRPFVLFLLVYLLHQHWQCQRNAVYYHWSHYSDSKFTQALGRTCAHTCTQQNTLSRCLRHL